MHLRDSVGVHLWPSAGKCVPLKLQFNQRHIFHLLQIDYNHFCNHVGPHKNGCMKCKQCLLWTAADDDDRRAIQELKQQGKIEWNEKGTESCAQLQISHQSSYRNFPIVPCSLPI